MNVLITGATGLIGKHLVNLFNSANAHITVLTRNKAKASICLGKDITFTEHLTQACIENQDVVINLAGEPIADHRWTPDQKHKICHSRWHITEQLTQLFNSANNPPKLLISGSAIGIYGRQSNLPIDEHFTQYTQEFTHKVCAKWERLALAAESPVTRVAILRTGIVLDKNAGALAKMLLPFKFGIGGKISHGQQMMSWIHIKDMSAAILHIINTETLKGVINITAEQPVTNQVFAETLASTLKRPCLFTTPAIILKLLFGEMADLLLFGQNVIPNKLKESGFTFKYPTIKKALKDLLLAST